MKHRRLAFGLLGLGLAGICVAAAISYHLTGLYGFNVVLRRGASLWIPIGVDDVRISPSMRLALGGSPPRPSAGKPAWTEIVPGFETAEMPVTADGGEIDRILLARFDPHRWQFEVLNRPAGDREPADWLSATGAAFVINGAYFEHTGLPAVPIVSGSAPAGPARYDARHGAFVSSGSGTSIVDLAQTSWKEAFEGTRNATVSYPLLVGPGAEGRVAGDERWLANRSFVGEDREGRIVFGTTTDAFFSLGRLSSFLASSPLNLKRALNLDGGPVACQGIDVPGHKRDFCGRWEIAVHDGQLSLLQPMRGSRRWGLPMAITAAPRARSASLATQR